MTLEPSNIAITVLNTDGGVDIYRLFSELCCPLWVETLKWAKPTLQEANEISNGFIISELSLNQNRPMAIVAGDDDESRKRNLL